MPRYTVRVRYEQDTDIHVYARDEAEAMEKAEDIVSGWNNVISAESQDAEEE
ncbi:MAG: hypothetical protein KDK24_10065 [Pseudooceanicola sp.]|nr:hypothetical protein [Pseudooceanicola sp.]